MFCIGSLSGLAFSSNLIFLPLMIMGLVSLFYFIYNNNLGVMRVFIAGCAYSLGQLFVGLYWIAFSFEFIIKGGLWVGLIAVLFLAMFLSIFTGIFCALSKYLNNLWNLNVFGYALLFSSLLSIGEYIRGNLFGGFPWNILGYIWSQSYVLMQPVSLIGIHGLGLISFLGCIAFTLFFYKIRYGFYAVLPLISIFIYSILIVNLSSNKNNNFMNVRVVQPSIQQDKKWDKKLKFQHLEKLIKLSLVENNNFNPSIIIWPESGFPYNSSLLEQKTNIFDWLKNNQILITGATRTNYKNNKLTNIYNSAYIIDNSEQSRMFYDKIKLVPFGEYNPFKKFINFNKMTDGAIDFSSGQGVNTFYLSKVNYKIGLLICYEIIFSGQVINGTRPDVLINITNDAWYGDTYGPIQHLASARARAIEEGLPLVRSANTGVSAVIDGNGRFIERLEIGKEGVLDISVPITSKKTIFSIYGNKIYILILIFMLMLARFVFISRKI
ncbi:apolipoprotein N-acyltransferase [Alphaproteobacteria bacterium]|nr:apolipoprotein N-acyltransferase [Alphaproteobacteria bacterium]